MTCKLSVAHFVNLVFRSITGNAFSIIIVIALSPVLTLRYSNYFCTFAFISIVGSAL